MRYPLSCRVFGNAEGFAGQLRDQLAMQGATIISSSARLEHRHLEDTSTDVLFLDLHDLDLEQHDLDALTRHSRLRLEQRPILVALANSQTALDLLRSYAWAAGFDDVIEDDELELTIEQRLNSLALLAKAKREAGLRTELSKLYAREKKRRVSPHNLDHRARILVVGRASIYQVKIVDALPAVRIAYAETIASARAMAEVERFDLILADCALAYDQASADASENLRAAIGGNASVPLIGICASDEPYNPMSSGPFDDILMMPLPTAILRLRIELWMNIAKLQGWQRPNARPLLGERQTPLASMTDLDDDLVFDRLTGLPGHAFTMDCVRLAARHAQLNGHTSIETGSARPYAILIAIDNFASLSAQAGYAVGNRLLAKCAAQLRRGLRAADFLGYLGNGQFLVVLPLAEAEHAETIAKRAKKLIATIHHSIAQSMLPPAIRARVTDLPAAEQDAIRCIVEATGGVVVQAEPDVEQAPAEVAGEPADIAAASEMPVLAQSAASGTAQRFQSRLFGGRRSLKLATA
ncbi:MAG: diguanylate cyclase [Pseudomonadota bacterium]